MVFRAGKALRCAFAEFFLGLGVDSPVWFYILRRLVHQKTLGEVYGTFFEGTSLVIVFFTGA
jgi:hypothetical protein